MIPNLLIGITFHYVKERIQYLQKTVKFFPQLSRDTEIFIVTNTKSLDQHEEIREAVGNNIKIYVPKHIGHPYLLTWAHFDIFREFFHANQEITHFMYLEDDIQIKPNNIKYWLKGRENLRKFGLIPSFLRYEIKDSNSEKYSTDITIQVKFNEIPKIKVPDTNYYYINFPQPYQGMYLLDRDLAREHLFGLSSDPDFGKWRIREKAAQGLTFASIPYGFTSRNLVGYDSSLNQVDHDSLIHHIPNNYANNSQSKFGKLRIQDLII